MTFKARESAHVNELRKQLEDAIKSDAAAKAKARKRLERHASRWERARFELYDGDEASACDAVLGLVRDLRADFEDNEGLEVARNELAEKLARSERAKKAARKRSRGTPTRQRVVAGEDGSNTSVHGLSEEEFAAEQARAFEAAQVGVPEQIETRRNGFRAGGYGSE